MRTRRPFKQPHIYTDELGYTYIDGYRYMGRVRVPSLPNRIAMLDRTTREYQVLSHSGAAGSLLIDLVDINTNWRDVSLYGDNEGPYTGDYRIYLDNGTLAAEYAAGYSSQTILTRRNFDNVLLRIEVDPTNGQIVYTEYEL